MDVRERRWLYILIAVFVVFNAVTLSPLVPWQRWLLWDRPTPAQRVELVYENYEITLPAEGIEVRVGEPVEFAAVSRDVTYGLGVFRTDGSMVFQMQVIPAYQNSIVWEFDSPGLYAIRSTEYSGPDHPGMFVDQAIRVVP
jgi:cytochrome c oxidase subunit 2